jgi:hypothetical protein
MRRLPALLACTALVSCGAPRPEVPKGSPIAPAAEPAPTATPTAPALGLVGEPPPAAKAAFGALGELVAHPRSFAPVSLPPGTAQLVDISAKSPRDVWMVAKGGRVLRFDGARAKVEAGPRCFVESCCGTLVPRAGKDTMPVEFEHVDATGDEVVLTAYVHTGGMRPSVVRAPRRGSGWSCEQPKGDLIHPGGGARGEGPWAREISALGSTIRLEPPAVLVNVLGGYVLTVDGRRVPLPAEDGYLGMQRRDVDIAARSGGELWLWASEGAPIWRGDGLTWTAVPTGLRDLTYVWLDPASAGPTRLWAIGSDAGGEYLARLEADSGLWRRVKAPGATRALGTKGPRFWVIGTTACYEWDGQGLRRADVPFDIERAWLSPGGELWVVGGAPEAPKPKGSEGEVPAGAAARLVPAKEAAK